MQEQPQPTPKRPEFHTIMMDSTVKIIGPSVQTPGAMWGGTGFIVGKPIKASPGRAYYVLVTAAHVLSQISGEDAILITRTKTTSGVLKRAQLALKIRTGTVNQWTKHPTEDVAVMYLQLPSEIHMQLVPQEFLGLDDFFAKYEIHPGDEVFTVGYPRGVEVNDLGCVRYAIVNSHSIAS